MRTAPVPAAGLPFFFQAEDGIRDHCVTGVQTCALPISVEGLVECKTYRWHGHSEHDKAYYRTDEELAMWKSRDPIPTFTTYLQSRNVLDDARLKEVEGRVASTIDEAVEFAMNAPDPKPEDAVTDLYA